MKGGFSFSQPPRSPHICVITLGKFSRVARDCIFPCAFKFADLLAGTSPDSLPRPPTRDPDAYSAEAAGPLSREPWEVSTGVVTVSLMRKMRLNELAAAGVEPRSPRPKTKWPNPLGFPTECPP